MIVASSLEALVTQKPNTKFGLGVQLDLFYSPVPNPGSKSCIETPRRTIFTAPLLRDSLSRSCRAGLGEYTYSLLVVDRRTEMYKRMVLVYFHPLKSTPHLVATSTTVYLGSILWQKFGEVLCLVTLIIDFNNAEQFYHNQERRCKQNIQNRELSLITILWAVFT